MKTFKFSVNPKLNGAMNEIYNDLLTMCDNDEDMSRIEIKRYVQEFSRESDYNIAQYGNLLIYYYDIKCMYMRHGYKNMDKRSDSHVWELYKNQVGYIARLIASNRL
jgi:hypothetical protein